MGGLINFVKDNKVFLYKPYLGFSINLAKVSKTKKTIAILNQLSGRYGYSYIRIINFLV